MNSERWNARERARELAREGLARGDAFGWFEQLYAEARNDPSRIPWADESGHPLLLDWLERAGPAARGARALVVGCGLGEDARALASAGWTVTAFDVSPTAIGWCRGAQGHGTCPVSYVHADLFAAPVEWRGAFELVFECYTLQALPARLRPAARVARAGFVAPGGNLLVVTRAREPGDPEGELPWPLLRSEVSAFSDLGLTEREFAELPSGPAEPPTRHFRACFEAARADGPVEARRPRTRDDF